MNIIEIEEIIGNRFRFHNYLILGNWEAWNAFREKHKYLLTGLPVDNDNYNVLNNDYDYCNGYDYCDDCDYYNDNDNAKIET